MILDPYGGPGGWAEGLRALGHREIGIELDPWACATRRAAGHHTIRADTRTFPLDHLAGQVEGLIMSPPCQAFSAAGKGEGRALLAALRRDVDRGHWTAAYPERVRHVLEVGRWAEALRPRWIACEQVPPVLPLWESYAQRLRADGYSAWAGILNAADYGVPQTRRRAFLLASLDRVVEPPAATHAEGAAATFFGQLAPWVSMAAALGWEGVDHPARTLCGDRSPRWLYPDPGGTHGRMVLHTNRDQRPDGGRQTVEGERPAPSLTAKAGGQWVFDRPATTIAGDARCWPPGHKVNADDRRRHADADDRYGDRAGTNAVRLTVEQALILQSFRPDYPVQGNKTARFAQVGNAVPPRLAAHVLAAVTGHEHTPGRAG